jgi:hypothetical protein
MINSMIGRWRCKHQIEFNFIIHDSASVFYLQYILLLTPGVFLHWRCVRKARSSTQFGYENCVERVETLLISIVKRRDEEKKEKRKKGLVVDDLSFSRSWSEQGPHSGAATHRNTPVYFISNAPFSPFSTKHPDFETSEYQFF